MNVLTTAAPPEGVVAVMLAAGQGRRFGSDKRQARLPDGRTMLDHACAPVFKAGLSLYLVLRPEDTGSALEPILSMPSCHRVDAVQAERGMGHSLAAAVAALPAEVCGCLVLLADMPVLHGGTLSHLARTLSDMGEQGLVAPEWGGRRGHPVGFGRHWFAELSALDGDEGGRSLLQREARRLRRVPVDDPGVVMDVNRPEDLARLHPLLVRETTT